MYYDTPAAQDLMTGAPITLIINGSGLGVCLIMGFVFLTAIMVSRELGG